VLQRLNPVNMTDPTNISLSELIAVSGAVSGMSLHVRCVRARHGGQYLTQIKGRGMEFDESRPYQPGDDVRNIDWRVTARTGDAYSKLFREERERPVLISVDARSSMFFATRGRFKSVIAAEFAAMLAWMAHGDGDRVGGEIFNSQQHTEFRPRRGRQNVLRMLQAMAELTDPAQVSPNEQASLEIALRRIQRIAHPGSLVCVISDFRGLDAAAASRLIQIARHNEIILIQIYDWLETQLPDKGQYSLGSADKIISFNAANRKFKAEYMHHYQSRLEDLRQLSRRYGMTWLQCATSERPLDVLRQVYGKPTRRQA
jgi:uncharacterized protein (DUF58 family)